MYMKHRSNSINILPVISARPAGRVPALSIDQWFLKWSLSFDPQGVHTSGDKNCAIYMRIHDSLINKLYNKIGNGDLRLNVDSH